VAATLVVAVSAGCGGSGDGAENSLTDVDDAVGVELAHSGQFPDVVDVEVTRGADPGTWDFAVTMSSPYDSPSRYADGWRVVGPDGTVFGIHTLTHDHAAEQPFTRRQYGVEIPPDVTLVTIEGRDLANGFGGTSKTIDLTASDR
jgi:hypothetical protein